MACAATACVPGTGSHLVLRHQLSPLADFLVTFLHKLTGAIAFLAPLPSFSFPQDSFRNKIGKVNHPQTNRVFVLCTTRCPSATNYLSSLIQSLLPYREQNYKAVLQYQTHHSLRPTLASSGSWQTAASRWVSESAPASPPARGPRREAVPSRQFHWQGGVVYISPTDTAGGCPAQPPPATLTGQAGLCRSAFQKQKVRGHTW